MDELISNWPPGMDHTFPDEQAYRILSDNAAAQEGYLTTRTAKNKQATFLSVLPDMGPKIVILFAKFASPNSTTLRIKE